MKCTKCGIEIDENVKFCPGCGTKNEYQGVTQNDKHYNPNSKILISIVIAVLVLIGIIAFSSSKIENKMWVCDDSKASYPDTMILYSGGSAVCDGIPCTWEKDGGQLTLDIYFESYTYDYSVSFGTLKLDNQTYHKSKSNEVRE